MARGIAWSLTEPKFSSHALVDGELTLLSAAAVVRRQTSAAVVRHGAPVPARSPMMPCTQHATCQPLPTLIPRVTGCTGRAWRSCAFPWQLCCVAAQFSRCQRAAVLHLIDFGWRLLCTADAQSLRGGSTTARRCTGHMVNMWPRPRARVRWMQRVVVYSAVRASAACNDWPRAHSAGVGACAFCCGGSGNLVWAGCVLNEGIGVLGTSA